MPKPAARPTDDASRPSASASSITEPRTCRRVAPTIRSSPNSRERWATVIESVLKIVNAPTKIATKPNTSSTIRMIEMNCSRPVEREAVVGLGGLDLRGRADRGRDGLADVGGGHAVARRRRGSSRSAPSLSNSFCAVSRSNTATVAVPSDLTVAERAMPTTSYSAAAAPGSSRARRRARSAPSRRSRRRSRPRPGRWPSGRSEAERVAASAPGAGSRSRRRSTGRRRPACRRGR